MCPLVLPLSSSTHHRLPMDPTDTNSQEHESDSTHITQISNPEETNQVDVSPLQVTENGQKSPSAMGTGTETTQETRRNDDGFEIENDVGKDREEKHLEKDKKGCEDVLEETQMQKTHDMYCPNCTHNITETVKRIKKGEEEFPYNKEKIILWFVIVISYKYPFICLPWLDNKIQGLVPSVKKLAKTLTTSLVKIREKLLPNRPTSQQFLLVLVLLLLSVILLWILPSPPSPPPPSPINTIKGGGSWLINFLRNNQLSVILLLFLAILAVLWRSMIVVPENDLKVTDVATDFQKHDDAITDAKVTNSPGTKEIAGKKPTNNVTKIEDHALEDDISIKVTIPINLLPIKIDIIKSIVYGGLIESITSFGVVSSAAASGTSTLNVLALGLANLFSGLFIIIHSLYGLFRGPRYPSWHNDHMPEVVTEDPYEQLLGKRNRVILHCFVVLISFIFFGVIPPLFYGFSFKIIDKGHYEQAAVVVAASLVCVISLSFAKAYAFSMDKIKTVAAYTGIAIVGSALSFIASQHARDVFAEYDFHKLASDYLKG